PHPLPTRRSSDLRGETAAATLANIGLPNLAGTWYYAGPFDNADRAGFTTAFPPEKGVDLKATYAGKNGGKFGWKELPKFVPGREYNLLPLFPDARRDAVVYL